MTHFQNLKFVLQQGIHCPNSGVQNAGFIPIGFSSLVSNRGKQQVKVSPGGVLNDYVPFYFHYQMPMLHKIFKKQVEDYTGAQEEIIYLVSSVEKVAEQNLKFVFTDRHAYLSHANHFNDVEDLKKLNFDLISDDEWMKTYSPENKEFKQAEFLVHKHFPVSGIAGIVVHNEGIAQIARQYVAQAFLNIQVVVKPEFYFS